MKKMLPLACLLAVTLFTSGAALPSAAIENRTEIGLSLNGQSVTFSSMPLRVGSTLMVPLRDLSEALNVQVSWEDNAQTATAVKGDKSIKLSVDNVQAFRGEQPITLDVSPRMESGKLFVPLRFFSESFDFNVYWDALNQTVAIHDADKSLPTVGSLDNMKELFKEYGNGASPIYSVTAKVMAQPMVKEKLSATVTSDSAAKSSSSAPMPAPAAAAKSEAKADYSGTNVQVEGVDESDIIKTDGSYIYQVNKNRVIVASAYPAEQMKVVQTLIFDDKNFRANELYIDDKYMVVIGSTSYPYNDRAYPAQDSASPAAPAVEASSSSPAVQKMIVRPSRIFTNTTKAIIYELGDRTQFKKVREVELEGNYISSRKVGASLYLVANKGFNVYPLLQKDLSTEEQTDALASAVPTYRDSAADSDSFVKIGYEDIRYFPNSVQPNYLMVAGLNLDQPTQKMDVTSYLGSGNQVYASQTQLYVTTEEYTSAVQTVPSNTDMKKIRIGPGETNSVIYKFTMNQGKVVYTGRGKVPGRTLNQFSMDEHNGYFRIATTTGYAGMTGEAESKNNMYVLNESMNIAGKIEDIAPGEQIYSVRYAGNKAYMVTFRTVDPLFVIDLKEPQEPKILGKLKIPGYSNYLHPYDENHLIGFGKDAVEVSTNYGSGLNPNTIAYYQGMKMAMFDVSDVANPKELYSETIGGRGTESELLQNHKALLFSKEKNLLAFPVTVRETNNSNSPSQKTAAEYGQFTFQGAYVYKLDLASGFKLQGKITHLTDEDYLKAGQYQGLNERSIQRILYIGDILYTTSQQVLKATDSATLQDVKAINLPQ
ncbi:beta-propeller domain-containing protein [Paenibacillus radicis (ex Xue et al. 2023)]|uniref:Beta-propeller domain-containing protein n=1 Tax=Paenibacillus radicis (ex Xue et al. 2023) TaxID=2972489 RepID=A0ABT1YD09_9BACL|nr:beta-propeller domain-containing protein [Paenibacillus radicis (ex Xue et al. 2023)]MCR8631073.1 beta-propeller domain-containing protein [Paenibacillus radicis (ex Xue et al. 2023)]